MEIQFFECLDSTQKYLINLVREEKVDKNIAIVAKKQTSGIGSRNRLWSAKEGDLLLSFAIKKSDLPSDLPIASASIYFAFLMKETLKNMGQKCWLKWPNDIYIKNKKCAGVITQLLKGYYVVGIGVNLVKREDNFAYCQIDKNVKNMLNSYFLLLNSAVKWQEVLSKFRLEFEKQNYVTTTVGNKKILLKDAKLCDDGALLIENERIYSLR